MKSFLTVLLILALFFGGSAVFFVGVYNGLMATSWHGHAIGILMISLSMYMQLCGVAISHGKRIPRPWKYTTEIRRG